MIGRSSLTPAPPLWLRPVVAYLDSTLNPPAGCEFAADTHRNRFASLDQVSKNAINRILVEDAEAAVGRDVFLQGFKLKAPLIWNIAHVERAKIRQAGSRANGCVFWKDDFDFIIRILIFPALDLRQHSLDTRSGVLFRVSPHGGNLSQNQIEYAASLDLPQAILLEPGCGTLKPKRESVSRKGTTRAATRSGLLMAPVSVSQRIRRPRRTIAGLRTSGF
jgi:hypothetical protein